MITGEKKIKDIYKCTYIETSEKIYPLQKWYNQLIDKKISEINVSDILKMFRQNEFIDLAMLKAINFLKKDPFAGDMYEGELLEKLSKLDSHKIKTYSNELKEILSKALEMNKNYKWLIEEEREEFIEIINSITILL